MPIYSFAQCFCYSAYAYVEIVSLTVSISEDPLNVEPS